MIIRDSLFKYEEYDFELDLLTIFTFFVNSVHDVNRKVYGGSRLLPWVANEKKEAGLCSLIGLCPAYSSFILALSSCAELKTMGFTKVANSVSDPDSLNPDRIWIRIQNHGFYDENFGSKNAIYFLLNL